MAKRCYLCGGRLNGWICSECGLDNSKSDANYRTTADHHHEDQLTHSHDDKRVDPFEGKTMTYAEQQELKREIENRRRQAGNYGTQTGGAAAQSRAEQRRAKKKRTSTVVILVIIIFIIMNIFPALLALFYQVKDEFSYFLMRENAPVNMYSISSEAVKNP